MGTLVIAVLALFIGIWHEINRFPATGKSIIFLQEELIALKDENESLRTEIDALKDELLDISNQIARIKDPEYYALLDAGDGDGLYSLDKLRGNI